MFLFFSGALPGVRGSSRIDSTFPTSTPPTRNSVHVSCFRYAIAASLPRYRETDYSKITPENASDKGLQSWRFLRVPLRNKCRHHGRPETVFWPFLQPPRDCHSERWEQRVWFPHRNENSPAQNHPVTDAWPAAPSLHTRRATSESA